MFSRPVCSLTWGPMAGQARRLDDDECFGGSSCAVLIPPSHGLCAARIMKKGHCQGGEATRRGPYPHSSLLLAILYRRGITAPHVSPLTHSFPRNQPSTPTFYYASTWCVGKDCGTWNSTTSNPGEPADAEDARAAHVTRTAFPPPRPPNETICHGSLNRLLTLLLSP